jgi:integrase
VSRPRNVVPTYRRHRATDRAFVFVYDEQKGDRVRVYLGRYGSEESKAAYQAFLAEWRAGHPDAPPAPPPAPPGPARPPKGGVCVAELAEAFLAAELVGYSASETKYYKAAVGVLCTVCPLDPAAEFGPRALIRVRDAMVAKGWTREHVNAQARRVRAVFRWGEKMELVPAGKWFQLRSVDGLKKGKTRAPEQRTVEAVGDADVEATLPHLTPTVAAMVRFHRLTGCRPQDVCGLTPGLIDRGAAVWVFRPDRHKRAHAGETREVYVGPAAQAVLAPYLDWAEPDLPVFRPRTSAREQLARRRAERRPRYPSQVKERQQAEKGPSARVGLWYTTATYNQAIERACGRAGVAKWTSNQLRHAAGVEFRGEHGLDVAQKLLGHKNARTTERYSRPVDKDAVDAAKKSG